jgi:hypothetical protein
MTNNSKPQCQCPNDKKDTPCKNPALEGELFCKKHMNCKGAPTNGYEPEYIPQILNKSKKYLETHNCLSYALRGNKVNKDLIKQCTDTVCSVNFEQPGAASNQRKAMQNEKLRTCPVVEKLTKSDLKENFIESDFSTPCPKGMSKVAAVVDETTDYHWYRQNPNGKWSHKDGSNPVKDFDAKKQIIFNPKQASRNYGADLNYEDFCGFYCVSRDKEINLKQGGKRRTKKAKSKTQKGGSLKRFHKNMKTIAKRVSERLNKAINKGSTRKA